MSEKLEKLELFDLEKDEDKLLEKLNAAIDRINELEARYEKHEHGYASRPELKGVGNDSATTPPIPGGDDAR